MLLKDAKCNCNMKARANDTNMTGHQHLIFLGPLNLLDAFEHRVVVVGTNNDWQQHVPNTQCSTHPRDVSNVDIGYIL